MELNGIAKKFHVSEILIGLTIVSIGTTLPELIVTIISITNKSSDMIVGNAVGSCLCNLLLILGTTCLLKPIKFEKVSVKQNLPFLILIIFLVLISSSGIFTEGELLIPRMGGILLLILALIYFAKPIIEYIKSKNNITEEKENSKQDNIFKCIALILLGGVALKFGGDFVVNSSTKLAMLWGISERVISLTIVAIGTSLPELVTAIVAIIKGNEDIAEGNIIGACIIDLTLVLGIGAAFSNLIIKSEYIENIIWLLVSTIIIWLYSLSNKEHTVNRFNGGQLLFIYFLYINKKE